MARRTPDSGERQSHRGVSMNGPHMTQPKVESMAPSVVDPATIARLARECSIVINVQDARELRKARQLLPPGRKIYVSHLPKQTWQQTVDACREVREVGFDPVPHVPVRLLNSERALDELLHQAVRDAEVAE